MSMDKMFKDKFGSGLADPLGVDAPQNTEESNTQLTLRPLLPRMVELIKNDPEKVGQITDTLFKIPVTIGSEEDIWVYDSKEERDIGMENFQIHAINIYSSLNKWYTASAIYGELIGLKELAYDTWYTQCKHSIRQRNNSERKPSNWMSEGEVKEAVIAQFGRAYAEYNTDLINLRHMKELIDKAIIKALEEKARQMLTLGGQYRDERKQQDFLMKH